LSRTSGNAPRPATGAPEYALLAGVSLTWGTSYMLTKIAVGAVPPITLIATRTALAAVAMLLLLVLRRRRVRLSRRDLAAFALVGLMSNAAPLCLIAISVAHVDSSVTATTMALVPLITAFLAIFRGEYPTIRTGLGIAVGLAGLVVLFGPQAFLSFGDSARGAAAAIGAAVVFSGSLFAMSLVRHHDALTVAAISLLFAALWTLPAAALADGVPGGLPPAGVIGAVTVLALFNTAAANLLVFALVARAGATFTSYNNYLVPAIAVLCGSIFLGETLTARSVAGVALVLAGVAISTIRRTSAARPAPTT
jgi:drug/metabolite transporter (DMT)-like permease